MKILRNLIVFGLLTSAAIVIRTTSVLASEPTCYEMYTACAQWVSECANGACWCPGETCSGEQVCIEGWIHYQWVCELPEWPFVRAGSGYCWPNPTYGC
jgi:hypothetical protein